MTILPLRHGRAGAELDSKNYKYRYGYNGMEKDNEIKGEGNSYDKEKNNFTRVSSFFYMWN